MIHYILDTESLMTFSGSFEELADYFGNSDATNLEDLLQGLNDLFPDQEFPRYAESRLPSQPNREVSLTPKEKEELVTKEWLVSKLEQAGSHYKEYERLFSEIEENVEDLLGVELEMVDVGRFSTLYDEVEDFIKEDDVENPEKIWRYCQRELQRQPDTA